jgi:tol-pal system protein YbgF
MSKRIAVAAICVLISQTAAFAQVGSAELLVRIDRLENQLRQLTGQLEQLQYRNQQLETALKRLQDDNEFRFQELGSRGGSRVTTTRPGSTVQPVQPAAPGTVQPAAPGGRRSDAFDPGENPNAVGAPRALGPVTPQPMPGGRRSDAFDPTENPNAPGAPRALGALPPQPPPLVSPQGVIGDDPVGRIPAPRSPGSTGPYAVATAPPSSSPRDVYDLGNGYLQRKEYALAEEAFREFLKKYPSDRLAADAQYGVGESLFQRQSYHDAANAFVVLSKKYETSAKAPDALLRLGQSLAAINEKELACVAFGDVGRKYPRALPSVKQAVEREQKRVHC